MYFEVSTSWWFFKQGFGMIQIWQIIIQFIGTNAQFMVCGRCFGSWVNLYLYPKSLTDFFTYQDSLLEVLLKRFMSRNNYYIT